MTAYHRSPTLEPAARPRAVSWATRLIYLSAGLGLLGIVLTTLSGGLDADVLRRSSPEAAAAFPPGPNGDAFLLAGGVAIMTLVLAGVVLLLVLARFIARGRPWSRIVAAVWLGLVGYGLISTAVQPSSQLRQLLISAADLVVWVAIVVLLFRPSASAYFRATTGPGSSPVDGVPLR